MSVVAAPVLTRRRLDRLALTTAGPLTVTEVAVTGGLLCMVGVSVFWTHLVHGGLYADDWSLGALYTFPSHTGQLSDFLRAAPARPAQAIYLLLSFAVLGLSAPAQLSLALALGLLAALLFYAVLRALGVVRLHAGLMAVLALLFPLSDATKLWADASPVMLSVSFYCVGLLFAIYGFRRSGNRAGLMHVAGAAFYALSIMTYETTAILITISAPVFCSWAPRRALAKRTAADVLLAALILGLVTSRTAKQVHASPAQILTHAKAILEQGWQVFSDSLFPFHYVADRRLTLALTAVVLTSGGAVFRRLPRASRDRALLGQAFRMVGAGACIALAGWAVLVPGELGYSPAAAGDGTRVNGVAGFGVTVCVCGLLLICGVLVFRGTRGSTTRATIAASLLAAAIGAGYTYRVAADIGRWDTAATIRAQVLADVHDALPRLPRRASVYVTGYDEAPYVNIGSFDYPWDLPAAVQVTYGDRSLTGGPLLSPASMRCGPSDLTALVGVAGVANHPTAYGPHVYLVSDRPSYVKAVTSRRVCLALGGTASEP